MSNPNTHISALHRFNLFSMCVDQQKDIISSQIPTVTSLIVESPYLTDHLGDDVSALSYDPEQKINASGFLESGHYRLQLQAVIHQENKVAAIHIDESYQGFLYPVTYSPEALINDLIHQIRKEIQRSTGTLPRLSQVEHPEMGFILLHGDEADVLLNAHIHVDEINQEITLSVPLLMESDQSDSVPLENCTLDFQEDIEWTAIPEALHPALRSYLFDVDAVAVVEDSLLCQES